MPPITPVQTVIHATGLSPRKAGVQHEARNDGTAFFGVGKKATVGIIDRVKSFEETLVPVILCRSPVSMQFDRIALTLELGIHGSEPSRYIEEFAGKIYASDWPDESDDPEEVEVGSVRFFIVEADRALNEGEALFDVLDSLSEETFGFYEALFTEDEPRTSVSSRMSENRVFLPNYLLISRMELSEQYRGCGIGAQAVRTIIESLGASCRLIACKPFPLQYEGCEDESWSEKRLESDFESVRRKAWKKVRGFWSDVGFVRIPKTDYYLWPD